MAIILNEDQKFFLITRILQLFGIEKAEPPITEDFTELLESLCAFDRKKALTHQCQSTCNNPCTHWDRFLNEFIKNKIVSICDNEGQIEIRYKKHAPVPVPKKFQKLDEEIQAFRLLVFPALPHKKTDNVQIDARVSKAQAIFKNILDEYYKTYASNSSSRNRAALREFHATACEIVRASNTPPITQASYQAHAAHLDTLVKSNVPYDPYYLQTHIHTTIAFQKDLNLPLQINDWQKTLNAAIIRLESYHASDIAKDRKQDAAALVRELRKNMSSALPSKQNYQAVFDALTKARNQAFNHDYSVDSQRWRPALFYRNLIGSRFQDHLDAIKKDLIDVCCADNQNSETLLTSELNDLQQILSSLDQRIPEGYLRYLKNAISDYPLSHENYSIIKNSLYKKSTLSEATEYRKCEFPDRSSYNLYQRVLAKCITIEEQFKEFLPPSHFDSSPVYNSVSEEGQPSILFGSSPEFPRLLSRRK